jgi:PTS system mannose-specific IIB component/fructoselysine and glucoselysine-specific PTS system IIB component
VPIELYRIDDRLIHGQVVVGWGQPLNITFIVLVDDAVATSDWEQELYRMGVPPEMEVAFATVSEAIARLPEWQARTERGILLAPDAETMRRVVEGAGRPVPGVNIGGIHHKVGRAPRLRYVFLTPDEEATLRRIAALGVPVTAQDVPSASPVALEDVLAGTGA